jgi:hypothetical protein
VAQDRLRRLDDGRVVLTLKSPWADGTRQLLFEPLTLLEKLAARRCFPGPDQPASTPRRAGVPALWWAATVDRDGRGARIRAILAALARSREREGECRRARPGSLPVPRW